MKISNKLSFNQALDYIGINWELLDKATYNTSEKLYYKLQDMIINNKFGVTKQDFEKLEMVLEQQVKREMTLLDAMTPITKFLATCGFKFYPFNKNQVVLVA